MDHGNLAKVVAHQPRSFALESGLFARQVVRRVILPQDWPFIFDFAVFHRGRSGVGKSTTSA